MPVSRRGHPQVFFSAGGSWEGQAPGQSGGVHGRPRASSRGGVQLELCPGMRRGDCLLLVGDVDQM